MAAQQQHGSAPTKPPIWNDPQYRAIFFQALVLLLLILFFVTITNNTLSNLEKQGIASGFDFLEKTAGFSLSMSLIPYAPSNTYGYAFIVSLLNTMLVSVVAVFLATILGFVIGVARLSKNWVISNLAMVYIEIFRNIPLLLQIFFWYFAVLRSLPEKVRDSLDLGGMIFANRRGLFVPSPVTEPGFIATPIALLLGIVATFFIARWAKKRQMDTGQQFHTVWTGLGLIIGLPAVVFLVTGMPMTWEIPKLGTFNLQGGMSLIPEFVALTLALSIYTASFIAEIVRAGILAVSHGQTEAAFSLGLRPGPTLRLVVIPQALRVIIPPLTSQYLNLTKNSSLAAAIAYPDLVLVFAGTVLMQTGQAVEIIAMTMAVYLTISLLISLFMNWYNKKMALVER